MSARRAAACTRPISVPAACIRIFRRRCSTTSTLGAKHFPKVIDDIEGLLTENRIFKQRNVDIGVVKAEDALALGLLRRDGARLGHGVGSCAARSPTNAIPISTSTFPSARTATVTTAISAASKRCAKSTKIMKQCIEKMPKGPVNETSGKVVPPKRAEMKQSMEALIHHFKLYTEGYHVPEGEVYACVEAPKGEFGVYLVSDGSNKPYRCKIRAPGFPHLQAMDFLCKGHMIADVSAILGSLDIVFGEIDR